MHFLCDEACFKSSIMCHVDHVSFDNVSNAAHCRSCTDSQWEEYPDKDLVPTHRVRLGLATHLIPAAKACMLAYKIC